MGCGGSKSGKKSKTNPGGAVQITIQTAQILTNENLEGSDGTYFEIEWIDEQTKQMQAMTFNPDNDIYTK